MSDIVNNIRYNEDPEISICDILALGFNKIKAVFIGLVIGSILMGGYKGYKTATKPIQKPDEQAEVELQLSKSILTSKAEALKTQLNYLNNPDFSSSWMSMNPDDVVKYVITFAVDSENTANQYVNYYNSLEIDPSLKELVFFNITAVPNINQNTDTRTSTLAISQTNTTDTNTRTGTSTEYNFDKFNKNCFLKLTVYGLSEPNVRGNAKKLISLIEGGKALVTAISGEHNLIYIDEYTESGSKDIAALQYEKAVELENIATELKVVNETLGTLDSSKPGITASSKSIVSIVKSSIKWAAIGAILGAFLVCLYLLIKFIGTTPVTSSFEFANRTGVTYIGGLSKKRHWNERTADKLLNERVFASETDASAFITENAKTFVKSGEKILVASSFYGASERESADVSVVMNALKAAGCTPEFAGNALTSPEFIAKLGNTDSVIILEKRWNSRWQNIDTELETIMRLKKSLMGFVLV